MKLVTSESPNPFTTEATVKVTLRELMYLSSLVSSAIPEEHFEPAALGFETEEAMNDFDFDLHVELLNVRNAVQGTP